MKTQISEYFDKMSVDRDDNFKRCPILNYEQEMRQKAVIELLNPSINELILDIGCGNARDVKIFSIKGVICVGIDISKGMIKEAKKKVRIENLNVSFLIEDATNISLKNNIFDKVLCSEIIEHVPNWKNTIYEAKRILKKDGLLVITTPNVLSLYGLTKIIFNIMERILRKKRKRLKHPYDKWKTQKEILFMLKKNNFEIKDKKGICYIPGHWTYRLPNNFKNILVRLVNPIEEKIKNKATPYGYMIGISAIKREQIVK